MRRAGWQYLGFLVPALVAACGESTCPPLEPLAPCAGCARGDIVGGAISRSADSFAVRPSGGWARLCDGHLAWIGRGGVIEHESGLALDGRLGLAAVGPDDTAYVRVTYEDIDTTGALVAVAPDGSERWLLDLGAFEESTVTVTPTTDALYLSGVIDIPIELGGMSVDGIYVARLDPATGAVIWLWDSPPQDPYSGGPTIAIAPRADGALVVAGTLDTTTIDLGGTAAPVTDDGIAGFIGVLDADGHGVWARLLDATPQDGVRFVALLPGDAIAIAGDFMNGALDLGNGVGLASTATYEDQFVAVLERDGAARSATHVGDWVSEPLSSLATLGDAIEVTGGYADQPLSFGDGVVPVKSDAYLASITGGTVDWVTEVHGSGDENASVTTRAGELDAEISESATSVSRGDSLDVGRVHVDGDAILLAEIAP